MRDIEFRAKIKGDAGVYKVWGINWLDQKILIQRACGNEWVSFDKIQDLMQFTGLIDKNKIRIYEGDIVKSSSDYPLTLNTHPQGLMEIVYSCGFFGVRDLGTKEGRVSNVCWVNPDNWLYAEVIGNIYEHSYWRGNK